MGLFGGSKSKRTTVNQTDNRAINQADNAIIGEGNVLNMLDGGAIDLAGQLAGIHAESQGETFREASALSSKALSHAGSALDTVADLSGQQSSYMKDVLGEYANNIGFLRDSQSDAYQAISESNQRAFDAVNNATMSSSDKGLKSVQAMALAVVAAFVVLGVFK